MNAEFLQNGFRLLGDSSEVVQQLRKMIVALAISGRLTSPDEKSLGAADLRALIEEKKSILIKQGLLPKKQFATEVARDDLPKGFSSIKSFVCLGAVARVEKGKTGIASACSGKYPLVVTAAERSTCDHFDFNGTAAIVPLVSSAGHGKASIQRLHFQEGEFALGSILAAIFPHAPGIISPRFIFEYLTAFKEELLVSKMIGTANVSLSLGKIESVPIPLVTPSAQRMVDELMALCDQLEAARMEREAKRDRLSAASLAHLNTPDPDAAIFADHARFALNALSALTTRPDQIKQLRQTILNLAVRGKLVKQDPNDKPVRLPPLRQFAAASGIDDEVFEQFCDSITLPVGWQIAPLAQLSEHIVDCPHTTPKWTDHGEICIRTNQLRPGNLDLSEPRFVSADTYIERIERLEPRADDILYSREGGILGIACRVPTGIKLCLGQRLMLIRVGPETRADFLEIVLNSPFITGIAKIRTTGGAAPRVNMSTVRAYPIPLPPPAEQHRIVAKVDELMALCDRLEANLTTAADTRCNLLDALLAETLESEAPVPMEEDAA